VRFQPRRKIKVEEEERGEVHCLHYLKGGGEELQPFGLFFREGGESQFSQPASGKEKKRKSIYGMFISSRRSERRDTCPPGGKGGNKSLTVCRVFYYP